MQNHRRSGRFRMRDLRLISEAPAQDDPPLRVGDRCRLNSGGPTLLVVDVDEDDLIFAWSDGKDGAMECVASRAIARRV